MIRTFIAIPVNIPKVLGKKLEELRQLGKYGRIKWVNPDQMHLTLRFIGQTGPDEALRIGALMEDSYNAFSPEEVGIAQIDYFSRKGIPAVIKAGVEHDDRFRELNSITNEIVGQVLEADRTGRFNPHITLGRIKSLKDIDGFKFFMDTMDLTGAGSFIMDRIVFYKSELSQSGPIYKKIKEVKF